MFNADQLQFARVCEQDVGELQVSMHAEIAMKILNSFAKPHDTTQSHTKNRQTEQSDRNKILRSTHRLTTRRYMLAYPIKVGA